MDKSDSNDTNEVSEKPREFQCKDEDADEISCCSDVGDINISDSQVMIQLKEAEEEAELIREDIAVLRSEIEEYNRRHELTEEDAEVLQEKQQLLIEKLQQLDKLTCLIAKLMELAAGIEEEEEEEDEEPRFEDDLLPRVVVCSSWEDMMPKIVVCMDMKKKTTKKEKGMLEDDESGLSPEQREALEEERRAMEEEREELQRKVAQMEGEMRVMCRENEMLSKKVAELKQNQPQPFEFEMTVSGTQQPGQRRNPGDVDFRMGPGGQTGGDGNYEMGATLKQGDTVLGTMQLSPEQGGQGQSPPSGYYGGPGTQNCSGPNGVPGSNGPCAGLNGSYPPTGQQGSFQGGRPLYTPAPGGQEGRPLYTPAPGGQEGRPLYTPGPGGPGYMQSQGGGHVGPGGKKCRKSFLKQNLGGPCPCSPGGAPAEGPCQQDEMERQMLLAQLEASKPVPVDVNFKLNVGPTGPGNAGRNSFGDGGGRSVGGGGGGGSVGGGGGGGRQRNVSDVRNNIERQLQDIEQQVKQMQVELQETRRKR